MHPIVNIAVSAARAAGDIILRHLDRVDRLVVQNKSSNDFVSDVDRAAEAEIIRIIRRAHPNDAILAEESGSSGDGEREWIIDPLDGTSNYLHRFPHFCVSIAFRDHGRLEHAVIYDPLKQELFCASRGAGAQLNNRRIRTSKIKRIDRALIATGFPIGEGERLQRFLPQAAAVAGAGASLRRAGSAALDLAYVACGRLDGFWELGLQPWDIAAGVLLVRESGGAVTGIGGRDPLERGDIIAAGNQLMPALSALLAAPDPSLT